MTIFLIITSVTGILLAFHDNLDDWFNKDYLIIKEIPNNNKLPITDLHYAVQIQIPNARFRKLSLKSLPENQAVIFRVDRDKNVSSYKQNIPFQLVYVNPYDAKVIGTRDKNEWALRNTMTKIYQLHRNLLLGNFGKLVLGIIALLWTVNCFIGVYLTLPRMTKKNKHKRTSTFQRWLPAWKIRRNKNIFKLSYDAHQALSLWLWLMMFIIAWSSVGFNLKPVYEPVMSVFFHEVKVKSDKASLDNKNEIHSDTLKIKSIETPNGKNNGILNINMQQIDNAKNIAKRIAEVKGVTIKEFSSFFVDTEAGTHAIRFKTNLDYVGGGSIVTIHSSTDSHNLHSDFGVKWGFERSKKANVRLWLAYLHKGLVWGTSYKIFLVLVGLVVFIVSNTGFYLWWRGRKARLKNKSKLT